MAMQIRKPEEIENELTELKTKINENQAHIGKIYKSMKTATANLEKKLSNVRAPYENEINATKTFNRRYEERTYELNSELCKSRAYHTARKAAELGSFDAETFKEYLNWSDVGGCEVSLKKVLDNGLQVFRDYNESRYLKYYFVRGLYIVGFWKKRTAEYAGDYTSSNAWVGINKMTEENEVNANFIDPNKSPFHRKSMNGWRMRCDPTINQFMAYVEKMDAKKLKAIDLSDARTCELMRTVG